MRIGSLHSAAAVLISLFVICVLLPTTALTAGNTWYVSTSGDDLAAGTVDSPWRTIQHAVASAGPGDTVTVRGGAYHEAVIIGSGGLPGQPLTITAFPGETPVLDGDGVEWAGFQFSPGVGQVNISGFHIQDYRGVGVDVSGGNSGISMSNLDIRASEVGMRITWGYSGEEPMFGPADHISLSESVLHDNQYAGIDCTPGPCDDISFSGVDILDNGVGEQSFGADGLAVEKGSRLTIDRVRVVNNGGDGIDLNSRDGGPVEGIVVSRSVAGNNRRNGMKLWAGGRIENSLIYGSGIDPLPLAAFSGVTVELVNNTVAMNMWDASFSARDYAMTVGYEEGAALTGIDLTMVNNIFAFNTGPEVGSPTGIYLGPGVNITAESNNLFFSRDDCEIQADLTSQGCFTQADITGGDWTAETGTGTGDLSADPGFTDAAAFDLHISRDSPAVDTATATGAPIIDMDGHLRPRGAGFDIGAYEAGASEPPSLDLSLSGAHWDSYADYLARTLSVDFTLDNTGAGDALALNVTGGTSTAGTGLQTPLPLSLGDLPSGGELHFTLRFWIPSGLSRFSAAPRFTGTDGDGDSFNWP
ncbi:MAG: right-handed parallel beta-helix repeat-containing protein [Actinobacteria bacterium]|nr:right-handed parallel beta-helix repeat-containing protein [Actinomycetota bacterium]